MQLYTLVSFRRFYEYSNEPPPPITPSAQRSTGWSDLQGRLWRQKHQRFQTVFMRLSLVHCSF